MFEGKVSLRSKTGEEYATIHRGDAPIWALQWNPANKSSHASDFIHKRSQKSSSSDDKQTIMNILVVTDWNQTLAYYTSSGKQMGHIRSTAQQGDPLAVSFFHHGEYIAVSSALGAIHLWTKEGVKISSMVERPESWIWTCAMSPNSNMLAFGTHDGLVGMQQMTFHTVHALYHDRYAYRSGLTDVIIQHFGLGQSCRLQCREHVKKVAIYQDKVAIQLPNRVIIYEAVSNPRLTLPGNDVLGWHEPTEIIPAAANQSILEYRIRDKIALGIDCNLLVVTGKHLLLCVEKVLEMYDFTGTHERRWSFESLIRYIKVVGGPKGKEEVVVGTRDGWSFQVFLDNPFPIPLVQQGSAIRCIDINRTRTKIAIVDDTDTCFVYETSQLGKCELLYQEPNATSVSWNTDHDDMLCFSGKHMISIKANNFPTIQQPHQGFVVGFKGEKLFILHMYTMTVLNVPLANCLLQYLDKKDWQRAFQVACLGAMSEKDWSTMGWEALEGLQFSLAQRSFSKIKDHRMLQYVDTLHHFFTTSKEPNTREIILADILAARGKIENAADLLLAQKLESRAVTLYSDLMLYESALKIAKTHGIPIDEILKCKAAILKEKNDFQGAAETYIQVGDISQAVRLLISNNCLEHLAVVVQSYGEKMSTSEVNQCIQYFRQSQKWDIVANLFKMTGDYTQLIQLYLQQDNFTSAFTIAKENNLLNLVYLPYAQHLLLNDDFSGAQENFRLAGRMDLSVRVLEQMVDHSMAQGLYMEAAKYYWRLSQVYLLAPLSKKSSRENNPESESDYLSHYSRLNTKVDLIYAYHYVHQYISDPFTQTNTTVLFNMARLLVMNMPALDRSKDWDDRLSQVTVLYAFLKLAENLKAYNLVVEIASILDRFRLPVAWQTSLDSLVLHAKGKSGTGPEDGKKSGKLGKTGGLCIGLSENEDLHPICYACSATNPIIPPNSCCSTCGLEFIWSFHSFDPLPLIRFVLSDHSNTAYTDLGNTRPIPVSSQEHEEDPMLQYLSLNGTKRKSGNAIIVDSSTFSRFKPSNVLEVPPPQDAPQHFSSQLYYIVAPNVFINTCKGCGRLFHADDYEYLMVMHQGCPLCQTFEFA
jgi:intraflagellar transport protein 122